MAIELTWALFFLAGSTTPSSISLDQLVQRPSEQRTADQRKPASDILVSPIPQGRASARQESETVATPPAPSDEQLEKCQAERLTQESVSADCEQVLAAADAVEPTYAESSLLRILGYESNTAAITAESYNDLQNADALAANAGLGQGIRANQAAAIVASQRAGLPPSGPRN